MSRCAMQRSIRTLTLGQSPDADPVVRALADAGPDGGHAGVEAERGAGALTQVPGPSRDVGAAVIDRRHHGPTAVAELDLRPTRERLVGDAVAGAEAAAPLQAGVVVPG